MKSPKKVFFTLFAIASGGFVRPAKALDCTQTYVKAIPWQWTIAQTLGPKKNNDSFLLENDGPIFTTNSATGGFNGNITIGKVHDPGENCGIVGQIPNAANVIIKGILSGTYANTTLGGDIQGAIIETYTRAQATATFIGDLPSFSEGTGSGDFNLPKQDIFQLVLGVHPYVGTLNGQSKFGFGSGTFGDSIDFFAQLTYNASLTDPNPVNIDYLYPVKVPGPVPLMGLAIVFRYNRKLRVLCTKLKKDDLQD
jgi:hypothetical protein